MISTGQHAILDIYNVPFEVANDLNYWLSVSKKAAEIAETTILNIAGHQFEPQGVSGLILISESHISFHTFPEKEFVAFDFYTCGDEEKFNKAIEWIIDEVTRNIPNAFIKFKIFKRGERLTPLS